MFWTGKTITKCAYNNTISTNNGRSISIYSSTNETVRDDNEKYPARGFCIIGCFSLVERIYVVA